MGIYIFILLIIILFSLISYYYKNKRPFIYKFLFFTIIILLVLVLSLRNNSVGVDVKMYYSFFYDACVNGNFILSNTRYEYCFKLLTFFISLFTNNFQIYLSLIAFLTIVPIGILIYKYSKFPFLSILLFISLNFYAFTFSGLRQAIAMSILLISYHFIINRKLLIFSILVLLASLFHASALVFFPAYFLYKLKINKKNLLLIIIFDVLVFIFRREILSFFITNFYYNYEIVELNAFNWFIMSSLLVGFCSLFYKKCIANNYNNNGLYILSIIGVSLMIFASISGNAMRIANYYYIYIIFLIPEVIYYIKKYKDRLLLLISFYSMFSLLFVYLLYVDGYSIVPYLFFWN